MPTVSTLTSHVPALGQLVVLEDERSASRIVIAPQRGAIVTSFRVGERELLFMDETTLHDPTKNVRGGIPVLFPTPGKLEDDAWQYAGRGGRLKQHGFARTESWQVRAVARDSARVSLELGSSERTLAQFPWAFHAELDFSLDHTRLRIDFELTNRDSTPLPFALGYHPYFRVEDKAQLRIETRATRAFDNVAKQTRPFSGFDFTRREVDLHLLDHGSSQTALHFGDGARLAIHAAPEFALWVVWALIDRPFVCVEPWTAPGNALNTGERLRELEPGATYASFVELEYSGSDQVGLQAPDSRLRV
jgi:galactose mutarotase-like enzyme